MREYLLVGVGSLLGGMGRYGLSVWAISLTGSHQFPFATFLVNLLGCFFIGVAGGLFEQTTFVSPAVRLFLVTGILGGFTTFSAFAFETVSLLRTDQVALAVLNVCASVAVCLVAVWVGLRLGQAV